MCIRDRVYSLGSYDAAMLGLSYGHLVIDKAYVTASTLHDEGMVSIGYFKELTLEGLSLIHI